MSPPRLSRRSFLLAASALPVAGAPDSAARADRLVRRVFTRPASARRVGRLYLARHPAEASIDLLLAALGAYPERDGRKLSAWVAARRDEDFAADRIVTLDGWELALFEARLCALAALL
ncbi:MAG: hypothetical protein IT564_02880 [Rhodospirillales bacterium]|nr:hypothetical protein [Rhodospirillales bacterium]